jgi:hypothetical protein
MQGGSSKEKGIEQAGPSVTVKASVIISLLEKSSLG